MTKKNYENTDVFQPELDLIFDVQPEELVEETAKPEIQPIFHPHLAAFINDIMRSLAEEAPKEVPLTPRTSDDPFYIAQLRARELETLPNLDTVPILAPGLPFEQDQMSSRKLMGNLTQNELNRLIPKGVRDSRLAVSTFVLIALEHPTLKQYLYEDTDEVVVSGLFNGFVIDTYKSKETIVVPLAKPRILEPEYLRDITLVSAKMPVLGIDNWKIDAFNY